LEQKRMLRANTRLRYLALTLALGVCCWVAICSSAAADSLAPADLTAVPGSPFESGGSEGSGISYSPNGKFVVAANRQTSTTETGTLTMFDVSNTGVLSPIGDPVATAGSPSAVAFDPDGEYVAVVDAETTLPDGHTLCSSSCLSMYSVGSDGSLTAVPGSTVGTDQISSIAFSPNGNELVAGTVDSVVAFSVSSNGDLSQPKSVSLPSGGYEAYDVAFSPDGKLVAASVDNPGNQEPDDNTVELFSASGGDLGYLSSAPSGITPLGLAFSPSGDLLAVANRDSSNVSLFTVGAAGLVPVSGSPFTDPEDPDGDPTTVAFSPAGWLAVVNGDGSLTTNAIGANDELEEPGTSYAPVGLEPGSPIFSPNGQFLDILDGYTNQSTGDSEIYVFAGLAPPTATIKTPATGGTYDMNQVVPTSFSCADSTGAPGIASCTDSNGAAHGSGKLNTSAVGAQTYTVTAVSQDGLSSTAKITYTVLPAAVGKAGPVTVSGNTAKTTLSCTGASSQSCSITMAVTVQETLSGSKIVAVKALAEKKKKPKRTVKTIVIGSLSVKLQGGTKKTVKLTLNGKGAALVKKRLSVPAQVKITQGKTVLRSQRVTFKAPKKKPKHKG
jgi:WD40 repeat protein